MVDIKGKKQGKLSKKHVSDAGLDVESSQYIVVPARYRVTVLTGLKIAVPKGYVGLLWSRSGLSANHGIEVGAGCIDSSYRGEVMVVLYNHTDCDYIVKPGDRIAQLLTIKVNLAEYEDGDLDETDRGAGGFGSTGK